MTTQVRWAEIWRVHVEFEDFADTIKEIPLRTAIGSSLVNIDVVSGLSLQPLPKGNLGQGFVPHPKCTCSNPSDLPECLFEFHCMCYCICIDQEDVNKSCCRDQPTSTGLLMDGLPVNVTAPSNISIACCQVKAVAFQTVSPISITN